MTRVLRKNPNKFSQRKSQQQSKLKLIYFEWWNGRAGYNLPNLSKKEEGNCSGRKEYKLLPSYSPSNLKFRFLSPSFFLFNRHYNSSSLQSCKMQRRSKFSNSVMQKPSRRSFLWPKPSRFSTASIKTLTKSPPSFKIMEQLPHVST